MTTSAMQFDGTMGSAKAIAAWIDDPTKLRAGPGIAIAFGVPDAAMGVLDHSISEPPFETRVQPGDYLVKEGGGFVVISAEQFATDYPV